MNRLVFAGLSGVAAVMIVAISIIALTACVKKTGQEASSGTQQDHVTFSEQPDYPVFVDPETGCEYLGYASHGLTPRMTKQGGNWHQKGCK